MMRTYWSNNDIFLLNISCVQVLSRVPTCLTQVTLSNWKSNVLGIAISLRVRKTTLLGRMMYNI